MRYDKAESFFDLCVSHKCFTGDCKNLKLTLQEFGYKTVAVNQMYTANGGPKKKKSGPSILPHPIKFEKDDQILWLNRLTILLSEKEHMFKLVQDRNWKAFDIVAIHPLTIQALQNSDVDIISFQPTDWDFKKIHRKHLRRAVDRGLHFEITYGPAIDSELFSGIVEIVKSLKEKAFSKNIIFSSNSDVAINLRSPYDLVNLGFVLKLKKQQAKAVVSEACKKVLLHAESRKIGKSSVIIEKCES